MSKKQILTIFSTALIVLLALDLNGQNITISYDSILLDKGDLSFEGALYSSSIKGLPIKKIDLTDLRNNDVSDVKLTVVSSIFVPNLQNIDAPNDFIFGANSIAVQGQDRWFFEVIPVRKSTSGIEVITEFSFSYSTIPT
ncbi:MAG: hypothetical protein WAT79_04900, partial [Saprospiraceae bacterium]